MSNGKAQKIRFNSNSVVCNHSNTIDRDNEQEEKK
jgi:hypothetical protein